MTVLRSIEQKIESLFEGLFGRAFRTHVQPVELARKLAKEMDDHRTVSVSRVYVPNEYTVYLAPDDRAQFESYESSLVVELQDYLGEHARREGYAMLSHPKVLFENDADLSLGEFGIATRVVQPPGATPTEGRPPHPELGATMIYRSQESAELEPEPEPERPPAREVVALAVDGRRFEIQKGSVVIGRSKDCDLYLDDPNISRRHAEVRQEGSAFWLIDLDSTNGTEVNGRRQKRAKLEHGDTVKLGSTELVFRRELQ
jgi:hypothetical protein